MNFPQTLFIRIRKIGPGLNAKCKALCMHCATHLHATNNALNSVMPHCHDPQCLSGTNAHQAAARHGKQCQLHGGLGRQFRECRNLLQRAHARRHNQFACRHRTSVTCTAVAEAAPEIAERGEHTAAHVIWRDKTLLTDSHLHCMQPPWQQQPCKTNKMLLKSATTAHVFLELTLWQLSSGKMPSKKPCFWEQSTQVHICACFLPLGLTNLHCDRLFCAH